MRGAAGRVGLGAAASGMALSAVVACSSFGGTSSPADTTDGGAEGATPPAPPAPPPPPAPPSSGDGGTDAALADAECSWFCDDFDQDPWPPPGYDTKSEFAGGVMYVTPEVAVSKPRALRVDLPDDSGTIAHGLIPRSHFGAVSAIHCEVSLMLETVGTDVGYLLAFDFKTDSGNHHLDLLADNGATRTDVFEDNVPDYTLPALPKGTWTRIGVDYRLGTPTRVTFQGVRVNDPTQSPAADAGAVPITTSTITVGASRNNGGANGAWRVDYDDLDCEITP